MSKNNFRAVHKVIDHVTLNGVETQGRSRVEISDDEYRHGTRFIDREATDVYMTDGLIDELKRDDAVRTIGNVREIRYRSLDPFKKEL